MALGGIFAALAIVIMCLGGLIPFATFVCPVLCMLILAFYRQNCTVKIAWVWYICVAFLSILLGPDKEAAAFFLFLGYYPIVKPWFERRYLPWLWKGLLFNISTAMMYVLILYLFGMEQLMAEFAEMGTVLAIITLLLGNVTFFLLDRLLSMKMGRK